LKYFVTGLTGNFGSHLHTLFKEEDTVFAVSTRDNPKDLDDLPYDIQWIKADLSKPQDALNAINGTLDGNEIDAVILAAAQFGPNNTASAKHMSDVTQTQLNALLEMTFAKNAKIITIGTTFEVSENPLMSGQGYGALSPAEMSKKPDRDMEYAKSKGLLLDGAMAIIQNSPHVKGLHLTLGYMGMGKHFETTLDNGLQDTFNQAETKNYEGIVSPADHVVPRIEEFVANGAINPSHPRNEVYHTQAEHNFTRLIIPGDLSKGAFRIAPDTGEFYLDVVPK